MAGIRCAVQTRYALGEGPVWSPAESALYWVDIVSRAVHRLDEGAAAPRSWRLPAKVGFLAVRERGGLLVGLQNGVHTLDLATGAVTLLSDPEHGLPGNRFNDGTVDRTGRVWAGTMDDGETETTGALYRFDTDGSYRTEVNGVAISNGVGFSPDDSTMYHTDTTTRRIVAYDVDLETGKLGNRRVFAEDAPGTGFPDGLTVDAAGCVWSAKWDGWRLVRYAPDGSVDRVVDLPVQRPSSMAFGGPGLDRLYVTSASVHLSTEELAAGPLAGSLLVLDEPGAVGLPAPRCTL